MKSTQKDKDYFPYYLKVYKRNLRQWPRIRNEIYLFFGAGSKTYFIKKIFSFGRIDGFTEQIKIKLNGILNKFVEMEEWNKNFVREEDMLVIALAFDMFRKKYKLLDKSRILNVGFAGGMSYLSFRQLFPEIIIDSIEIDPDSIDYFKNHTAKLFNLENEKHNIYLGSSVDLNPKEKRLNEKLLKRVKIAGGGESVREHIDLIKNLLNKNYYNLIFLDGDHSYGHVLKELESIRSNLRDENGECLVAMHDIGREPGLAADEFVGNYGYQFKKINFQPNSPRIGLMIM